MPTGSRFVRRAAVAAVALSHLLLVQCMQVSHQNHLSPVAENGWVQVAGKPAFAFMKFSTGDADVHVRYTPLSESGFVGPVVPVVPIGSSFPDQLEFNVAVEVKSGAVIVDPAAIRFAAPCGPGVAGASKGGIAFARAPEMQLLTGATTVGGLWAGGTAEIVRMDDANGRVTVRAHQVLKLVIRLSADRGTIDRCTMRLAGLLPGHTGPAIPDAAFVRRSMSEVGGL